MIENNHNSFDDISVNNLENIFNINSNVGYSKVITNGAENSKFINQGFASADDKPFDMIYGVNEFIVNVPENEWSVVYFRNPTNSLIEKPVKDYSSYKTLKLELKGDKGGETVSIALKDANDPDDGSETRIPLTLSDKWETYEIPLSEFKTADLQELFIVASIIFIGDAQKINIRNIEYLK